MGYIVCLLVHASIVGTGDIQQTAPAMNAWASASTVHLLLGRLSCQVIRGVLVTKCQECAFINVRLLSNPNDTVSSCKQGLSCWNVAACKQKIVCLFHGFGYFSIMALGM